MTPMRPLLAEPGGLSPLTLALIVTAVLLFGRYLYLRSQRSAGFTASGSTLPASTAAPVPPLPSSGLRLWPSRKERLDRQTEYVRSHTDYILARLEEAKAMGGLVRARVDLSELLTSLTPPTSPVLDRQPQTTSALTLTEIAEIVDALPDVPSEVRALLMQLLAGRLAEKTAR